MSADADLVIAGAGPAGLAVAIHAASRGLSAIVLEKGGGWPDKACGEGVMPAGVRALERLGVRERLDPDGCAPFAGIRFEQEDGVFVEAPLPGGPGLGIRRTALIAALAGRARDLGVELRLPCAARSFRVAPDGVRVETEAGPIVARLLVAADGLASPLRAAAGLALPARRRRFGLRRHFRIAPWSPRVEVHFGAGAEAYLTPAGPARIGLAFLWEDGALDGRATFGALLARFPALAARLDGATPDSAARGAGPFERRTRARVADRLVLVGDAAGYVDAITGDGLTLSLNCAEALGALLPSALARGATAAALLPYERAFHRAFRRYAGWTRLLLALARRPRLRRRALAALAAHPRVFEALLAAAVGGG